MPHDTRSHADFRTDHYRGNYWVQAEKGGKGQIPLPSLEEKLRQEKIGKQLSSSRSFDVRRQSWPGPGGSGGSSPTPMVFPKGHLTDRMMDSTGSVRSLPTQIADLPTKINVNGLRSSKEQPIWKDVDSGVRTYNLKALTGNYAEERFDLAYRHGNGTRMFKRRYETTSMRRDTQATPIYQQKLGKKNMYAKQPEPSKDVRSAFAPHGNYINYACSGDGREDHSLSSRKKGAPWVGTAPVDMFQTTNSVAFGGKKHEYQTRSPSSDPKSRLLCTASLQPKNLIDQYRTRWTTARNGSNTFGTEYKENFSQSMTDKLHQLKL